MSVIDLIRHCLAYNETLKDDRMMLSSPQIAAIPHLNIAEFLLSGPLETRDQNKRKRLKIKMYMNSIPFTVSSSCKPPTIEA